MSIDPSVFDTILATTPRISALSSFGYANVSAVVFSMLAIYALINNFMLLFVMV